MTLYAVVIGRKGRNMQTILFHPSKTGKITARTPLAVYEERQTARAVRHEILAECDHKEVYVVPFERKEP